MTGPAERTDIKQSGSLPEGLLELLREPSPCFVATVWPDGSPHLTQTWVDTDGEHVIINIVSRDQKSRNIAHDPRVELNICDPSQIRRYYLVRGHVISVTTDGGEESVNRISQRYIGRPYPGFTGRPEVRLVVTIAVDSVTPPLFG
jgi:PPOX class probable F420-dependent enzyme